MLETQIASTICCLTATPISLLLNMRRLSCESRDHVNRLRMAWDGTDLFGRWLWRFAGGHDFGARQCIWTRSTEHLVSGPSLRSL